MIAKIIPAIITIIMNVLVVFSVEVLLPVDYLASNVRRSRFCSISIGMTLHQGEPKCHYANGGSGPFGCLFFEKAKRGRIYLVGFF